MNIEEIKRKLLEKLPLYGDIINSVTFIGDPNQPRQPSNVATVVTDGKNIYYNSEFINGLDDDQKLSAFANSILHIAFNDIERGKGRVQEIWMIAADAIVNKCLKEDGFKLVDNCIDIPIEEGKTAEDLYVDLCEPFPYSHLIGLCLHKGKKDQK